MSALIARCPHCETAFRLVPDQLRVRDGRVRCGVCQQIFDGRAALARAGIDLQDLALPVATSGDSRQPAAVVAAPGPAEASREPTVSGALAPPAERSSPHTVSEPVLAPSARHTVSDPALDRSPQHTISEPAFRVSSTREPVLGSPNREAPVVADGPLRATPPPSRRAEPAVRPMPTPTAVRREAATTGRPFPLTHDDLEMAADSRFTASRPGAGVPALLSGQNHSSPLRLLWGVGFWLALVALVLQAFWWWRTPLATHVPGLRAPLTQLCDTLGCTVGYVRAPQRLSIVSSSVQPDVLGSDQDLQRLQLQALLRNRAPHDQPWPALEVTLTDHADGVVSRRSVPPEVYLPAGLQSSPFAAGSDHEVNLSLAVRGAPITGYRLSLYFP